MAYVRASLVLETTTTTGTGTLTLAGAKDANWLTFAAQVGGGNTCSYAITASNGQRETGVGTVVGSTLQRTTLISSSTGAKLDLPAGTHEVGGTVNSASFPTQASDVGAPQTGGVREHWVDASAMAPKTTGGATVGKRESATNKVNSDCYLFDGATSQGVQFKVSLPGWWNLGTIKAKVYWDIDTGASAGTGVTWTIAGQALSDNDTVDTAFPTATAVDDTVLAVGKLHITAATAAITISGTPAAGDLLYFEVLRTPAAANDNTSQAAILLGVNLQYTESTTAPTAW